MNDRARAAVARRCVSYSAVSPSTMNAPNDVVLGRAAWVERAAHDDDFDDDDEPCSARWRAIAQDG